MTSFPSGSSPPSSPFWTSDYNHDNIVCNVGPNARPFTLLLHTLTRDSAVFKAMGSERWRQESDKPANIDLPNTPIETFNDYVHWTQVGTFTNEPALNKEEIAHAWDRLANLFILADLLCNVKLCNFVVTHIFELAAMPEACGVPRETLDLVVDNTLPSSPIRKVIADLYAWAFPADGTVSARASLVDFERDWDLPNAILAQVLTAACERAARGNRSTPPWNRKLCETYHLHPNGEGVLSGCDVPLKPRRRSRRQKRMHVQTQR